MNSAQLTALYTRWCVRRNAKRAWARECKEVRGFIKEAANSGEFSVRICIVQEFIEPIKKLLQRKGFTAKNIFNEEDSVEGLLIIWL